MGTERRGCIVQPSMEVNQRREEPSERAKLFDVPMEWFREKFRRVKARKGIAGVDGQSIEEFEADLEGNPYKLLNRMSSGRYFPRAVLRVEVLKPDGGARPLGIPRVADRVAQTVAKMYLESKLGGALPSGLIRLPAT